MLFRESGRGCKKNQADWDAPCRRNLAIRFLQLIGCEVDQVTDAESAIAKINSAPFDVVFMDIVLPKMTG